MADDRRSSQPPFQALRPVFRLGHKITILPVIHGSADCALEVRRRMLDGQFDCLALPLPPSFGPALESALEWLPSPGIVVQRPVSTWETNSPSMSTRDPACSFVPVDPCQPVIMALRIARQERLACQYIDLETNCFESYSMPLPDPYALKRTSLERFATSVLPTLPRLPAGQPQERVAQMATRLRELEGEFRSILCVCSLLDWPWIVDAYLDRRRPSHDPEDTNAVETYSIDKSTLIFLLGELPFISALYERARAELEDDENLSIDGIKELLIQSRLSYQADLKDRARKITPLLLSQILKYVRNLSLLERRLTPDLYTLIIAAKQIAGDQYALHVAETARAYPDGPPHPFPALSMGLNRARLPDGEIVDMVSRLPGPPLIWRSCDLTRRPGKIERQRWQMRWNPFSQCSWPPEDERIETFRSHLFDRARQIMGADLAKTEKFTSSIKDGIDIRDTVRHWYEGEIYVRVLPPSQGRLDCAVMLFDSPADPRKYPWRTTWFAEHEDESTLAFFATNFGDELVGPGICLATYGGALFLYPPRMIPDIWTDTRLDFTETLEERLLAAACLHSQCAQVALLSVLPPGNGWKRLAKRFRKSLLHVPLGQFSDSTIQQLRMVHVLNGRQVRSYASHFIRRP